MINRLRMKFALVAIISVLLVLVVLVGGINLFNYRRVVSDADRILDILEENDGRFPEPMQIEPPGTPPDKPDDRIDSPELAYETRYFSVSFDGACNIVKTDTGRIFAISDQLAREYAEDALSSSGSKGFIGDYRYRVVDAPDGSRTVIFCDCSSSLINFRNFRTVSITISAICLVLVSLGVYLISGRAVRPVAESYEKQKRFITDAGHEIKTPLAIINADSDVLASDIGDDNEWLVDIRKQTRRLAAMTDELVLLTKMEEGAPALKFERVDLSALVADQAESFEVLAQAGEKRLVSDVTPGLFVNGDRKALYELISILLDNAVKYCVEGGEVQVVCSGTDRGVRLEVTNGIAAGIPEASLASLFDRFYRADQSRNSETGGHGIGLSIARAITDAHKGRLTVSQEEREDGGADIRFTATFKRA